MDLFNRKKDIKDAEMLSPLVWAYVGDSIYEVYIRTNLVNNSDAKPHKLHIESIKYVKAKAQAEILNRIMDHLTEHEKEIVRRGRNTENHHLPKHASATDYRALLLSLLL